MADKVTSVKDGDFAAAIGGDSPVLVDFWAEWCAPCKQLSPFVEQLAGEKGRLKVLKMDIETNRKTPTDFGISSIPTLIIFKGGKELGRRSGLMPYPELRAWVDSVLA